MSRTCGTFGRGMRMHIEFWCQNMMGGQRLQYQPLDERIFHWIVLAKGNDRSSCCEQGGETSGSTIMRRISWLAEKLLVFS